MASHACSLRAAAPRSAHQGAPAGRWSPLIAPAARRRPAQRRAGSLQPRSAGEGGTRSPPPTAPDLQQQLRELDRLLTGDGLQAEREATQLAARLAEQGALCCFGRGGQVVPKRSYTLEELRLNKIQPEQLLSPTDTTLNGVRNVLQGGFVAGLAAAYFGGVDASQLVQGVIIAAFALTVDQVANRGGFEALLIDTAGRLLPGSYARRVALHEAGHFLTAYMLGLLPRGYALSSLELFLRSRQLNVQAGCQFCDSAFQAEVASGRLTSGSLDTYSCVALAGVATEWLRFGHAEGGMADVQQLDRLLQALRFTQAKADAQVRWAVLNTVSLLRQHEAVHDALAAAMQQGASVGECIAVIEGQLATSAAV